MLIDTAGCEVGEEGGKMESKMNVGEADSASHVYRKLINFGVRSKDIAVLTPYSKQVTLIKNILAEHQC
jgi:superfamily I DNA and/or RNA helicase